MVGLGQRKEKPDRDIEARYPVSQEKYPGWFRALPLFVAVPAFGITVYWLLFRSF